MLSLDIINIIIVKTGDLNIAISTFQPSAHEIYNTSKHYWNLTTKNDYIDVVKWLQNKTVECSMYNMNYIISYSHFDNMTLLNKNIYRVDENGHFNVVKWLHKNRTEGCCMYVIDTENGYLNVVKWHHENRTEGCVNWTVRCITKKGHLNVVKWFQENRTEEWIPFKEY